MTLLKRYAKLLTSNVDKKSRPDEEEVRLCNYTDVYYGDTLSADVGDYMSATATAEQIASLRLHQGDTVLTKDSETPSDIGRTAYISTTAPDFVCGYHLTIVRPDNGAVHPKFLTWALRTSATREYLAATATGVTRYGLRTEALARTPLALPSLDEQRRIADFLDDQVTLLDRAIELRQEQVRLLGDRADSVIADAVTPGGGGAWTATRLKYLSEVPITNGLGEAGKFDNRDWPRYVRTTDIAGPRALRDDVFASLPPEVAVKAMLQRGDFLMTAAGASIGKSVLFDEPGPACYAGFLVRLRLRRDLNAAFIGYWMRSAPYWDQINAGAVRSTIDNFSASRYRDLRILLPGRTDQDRIVRQLDEAVGGAERLVALAEQQTALLQERKQALITAAVTGAFDVSSAGRVKR